MTEMHEVVKILLERMKSNPEDFASTDRQVGIGHRANPNKWNKAYTLAVNIATEEEHRMLEAGYQAAKRDVVLAEALRVIIADEETYVEEPQAYAQYKATGRYAFGAANPNTILTTSALRNQASQLLNATLSDEIRQEYQNAINNA